MPGSLTEYALQLAQDPAELERFQSSSEAAKAAMTRAGLTPDEQTLMLSGDGRSIGAALAAQSSSPGSLQMRTEPMEHPGEEPMEYPPAQEPMEYPPAEEPMEHPPEAMVAPMRAAVAARRGG